MKQTAWQTVLMARDEARPKAQDFLQKLFQEFLPLAGDRAFGDDSAVIAGLASFEDQPVTVIAQAKGHGLKEQMERHFGMAHPEGYRKALRLGRQAEKFHRPILFFVDTPGAYPGQGAEERGQAQAIAQCLYEFSSLKTPILTIVLSEGGSGGALAFSVADRILFLEHAVYSILSPEGFASILWKDESRAAEAAEVMKLTSQDLYEAGFADVIIPEPEGGVQKDLDPVIQDLKHQIHCFLKEYTMRDPVHMVEQRQKRIRNWGVPSWMA